MCKPCCVIKSKLHSRTPKGLVTSIYKSQKQSSVKRGHAMPTYSKQELSQWVLTHELFEMLYKDWCASGYDKYKKPSVDRLDDYCGYTLENIQLVTWFDNNTKGHVDRKSGKNTKQSKSVLQFELDGTFLKEHHSLSEAGRENNMSFKNIHQAIIGRNGSKQSGGFIWKYKEI